MTRTNYIALFVAIMCPMVTLGQQRDAETGLLLDDPILAKIDSVLKHHFSEVDEFTTDVAELNIHGYEEGFVPEFSDSIYFERIKALNAQTPFEFEFNEDVLKYLHLFSKHRRTFTAICLGRSQLYFPMYEEKLDQYGLPMELKYLSVIESALNPLAKSPAGATGLWQFMLKTGKSYGLHVTSYTDDRRDPQKATEAACHYLKFLHKMYGDWSMALAAYNAGPGNVNRAIRRSGGKMTYWEIRDYLPRETQGYVPTFIAVTYIMTHAADHNIYPRKPEARLYEIDSVHFSQAVSMDDVADALEIDLPYLKHINPVYKTEFIPASDSLKGVIFLPVEKIGDFMVNLDTLHSWKRDTSEQESFIAWGKVQTHVVRRGESLGVLAHRYGTTISEIKMWNNMKTSMIHPGQEIQLHVPAKKIVEKGTPQPVRRNTNTASNTSSGTQTSGSGNYYYYTIRKGDTLWDIAIAKGVSVQSIKSLNRGLNENNLKIGQKIKIASKG